MVTACRCPFTLMGTDAHHPMWQNLDTSRRRHLRVRHGIYYKSLQRSTLFALWWIFVSPGSLFSNRTGGANNSSGRWSTQFVAGQSYSDSSSASQDHGAECDGRQQLRPAAFHSAVGHINYGVGLELGADIKIPGACEVNLPIDVSSSAVRTYT